MTIIAICGFIGSGKDTVADFLVNDHGFKRESFAGTLKDAVASVFGWDRELLEGKTEAGRVWREQVDEWWANRLNIPNLTPRWVLQQWGTEVCRKAFHDDIWVASLEYKLRNVKEDIVISDCRFPNEIETLRRAGAMIVWVRRGDLPEWYDAAVKAYSGDEAAKQELGKYNIHASETSWVGAKFSIVAYNTGTLEDLRTTTKTLLDSARFPG